MDAAVRTDNRAASPGRQATKRIASRALLAAVNPAAGAAVAIVQRLSLTLVPSAGGALAYLALRWRDHEALAVGSTRVRATGRGQRTLDVSMCRLQPVDQN
jgi:hypothetical protein